MNPFVVDVYYLSKGYQVSYYEKIDAAPKDHDVYILLYLYPDRATSKLTGRVYNTLGAHYIAIENQDGKLVAYNNSKETGSNFSDFTESDSYPASLWGIDIPD